MTTGAHVKKQILNVDYQAQSQIFQQGYNPGYDHGLDQIQNQVERQIWWLIWVQIDGAYNE